MAILGSGCDSVGREVAIGRRFESSLRQICSKNFLPAVLKRQKKEKEAMNGPFL